MAVFIQTVVGFGGNLIAMPLGIMLVGVNTSKPVLTILAWVTGIIVALQGWRHINVKELLKMTGIMFIGILAGLWIFGNVSMGFLIIVYAVIVILIGVKKLFFPGNDELPVPLQWTAIGIAGLIQGLFVSGGSFLVVYAVAKIKEKQVFRPTVNAVWAILNTFMIITYIYDGTLTSGIIKLSGICLIPCLVIIFLGGALAKRINQSVFLKTAYIILIVSGTVLLITNL